MPPTRWQLPRNCALTPRQALGGYALAALLLLPPVALAALSGYTPIIAFALLELCALLVALRVHARHAVDTEILSLERGTLQVEQHDGERCRVTQLPATWLRVGLGDGPDGLVTLSAAGRELAVGRHLVPAHRRQLAAELRAALHAALR